MDVVDPGAIHAARVFVRRELARACKDELIAVWKSNAVKGDYRPDPVSAGKRALQGLALALLLELDDATSIVAAAAQFADRKSVV